jgi:GxxExxY protein
MKEPDQQLDELAHAVIGAALEVHRVLGPGLLEAVYEEALCVELSSRRIPFVRQHSFRVEYRGSVVGEGRVDLLVDAALVVEIEAVSALNDVFLAQTLSYLKALDLQLGLLINFNEKLLRDGIRRVVRSS